MLAAMSDVSGVHGRRRLELADLEYRLSALLGYLWLGVGVFGVVKLIA